MPQPADHAGAPFGVMLRGALLPSLLVGLVAVAALWIVRGQHALAGSLFGLAVAIGFFAAGMALLSRFVRSSDPLFFLPIALGVYGAQVIGILLVILIVRDAEWVDRRAMAIVVLVVTLVWQLFAFRALRRAKLPIYDVKLPHETNLEER